MHKVWNGSSRWPFQNFIACLWIWNGRANLPSWWVQTDSVCRVNFFSTFTRYWWKAAGEVSLCSSSLEPQEETFGRGYSIETKWSIWGHVDPLCTLLLTGAPSGCLSRRGSPGTRQNMKALTVCFVPTFIFFTWHELREESWRAVSPLVLSFADWHAYFHL